MTMSKQMNFNEIYSKLGESGQFELYEQHGGGTLSKRPAINPLTGEKEKDNRAFSLLPTNGNGKVRFKCHKSGETGDLFNFLVKKYGKPSAIDIITNTTGLTTKNNRNFIDKRSSPYNKFYALKLWEEATPDTKRIKEYFASRSITLSVPDTLRFHNGKNMMVAPVSGPDGTFQAIHRTFFKEDGSRSGKKMLGPVSGGSVHLAVATEKVAVCEGIETGLSFQQATGIPTHAALSVPGMQNYIIPEGVKELYIIADSDKKDSRETISKIGQKAAKALAEKAEQKGIKAFIVYPCDTATSDNPEKMDFNDLLQKDPSGELIRQRLEIVKEFISKSRASSLTVISITDFLQRKFPPRKNLLSPWLPEQGICMIHAQRGVGKTFVSLGVACAVAAGDKFLLWEAPEPAGVLFLDGEMPAVALQERLQAYTAEMKQGIITSLSILTPDLQQNGMPNIGTVEGQEAISRYITDKIKLIIVDNISSLVSYGKENEAEGWVPIQTWALKLRTQGKSVLFIHHSNKSGGQRGTSKREDILDTVINLRHPPGYSPEDGACFEVHFEKNRGIQGNDVKPFEAKLTNGQDGSIKWETRSLSDSTYVKVVSLSKEGLSQKEIAEELGKHKSTISRCFQKAREVGDVNE